MGLLWISSLPIISVAVVLGGVSEKEIALGFFGTGILIGCFCAMGLLCSSLFRRSVHSTALAYAFGIFFNVLTAVWGLAFETKSFSLNGWKHAPFLLNPFYCMYAMLAPERDNVWAYDWVISLSFFMVFGIISALLAIRNIRRAVP
jgi:ABC-type polysaccharide/polyol phosphate export permease